ncbi:MAG: ABC transporter ATP-binding protein [Caldicoprobacterales bacterium]|jgi:ATP-binding cassette subfamily B multidrug efflux pump|nr:ABC transporter ATP-binding protein [Clostridiales bacterium]
MAKDKSILYDKSVLYKNLVKHRWRYVKGLFFLIAINVLQILVPRLTGIVVDGLKTLSLSERDLIYYGALLIVISLMIFASHYLSRVQVMGASNLFDYEVRNEMFDHMLSLSMRFFHKNRIGDLMALATNDLGSLRMILSRGFNLMINTVILLIGSIVVMAGYMDLRLTIYSFLPFPFLVWVMVRFGPMIHRRFRRVQESFSDLTRMTQENISGIRVIKAFVQEENEIENFARLNQENFDINMALARVQAIFYPSISLISSISFLIAFIYGGNLVIKGTITLGDFVAFNGYLGIIIRPITSIGMIINFSQRAKASVDRIHVLFQQRPEIVDTGMPESEEEIAKWEKGIEGKIEFRDLTFSYDKNEAPVLKDINLTIEPGKTLGIIGKVGSGKSTIANLILRLYNPMEEGQLLIDGVDITKVPLKLLRESIGFVPQDNFLFSSTIKSNIGFTPEEPDMEEIRRAARISQIDDTIMELPDKYETMLGERGVNLSGGQKQRVSIARALVKDPSILILDDCLSAVDTNTERKILDDLKPFMEERTCIIIAHRISTIQDADEIIVLDDGKIIERGTHEELLANEGYYSRIYHRQLLEEEIERA